MDFKGTAKKLADIDLPKLGALINVGEDEIHAFMDVETRGHGFDDLKRPIILFERHKFYEYLPATKRAAAVKAGLASKTPGGYGKESEQYGKLARAMAIDVRAALMACSWGLGQVMGFNHKLAGYATVEEFVEAMKVSEELQLRAAINFIISTGLADKLRKHDWAAFAKGYNGKNYKINNYDGKLKESFAKWSRIKDTPWSPDLPPSVLVALPAEPAKNHDVVLADMPVKDETAVVVLPKQENPAATPSAPVAPDSKNGVVVLLSIVGAALVAALRYAFGG